MLKTLTTIGLTTTVILVIGTFLWVQGSESRGERPSLAPAGSRLLAMQEPAAPAQDSTSHSALASMGWIGVTLEENNGHGVKVAAVFPAGPAAGAGVRVGDLLVRVGGADVTSAQTAQEAIEKLKPANPGSLTVERRGKAVELKVVPESLADFRRDYIHEMLRRDPRDPHYARHHGVSDADMQAEVVRRLFEQHERMERSLHEVLKELQALRQEVASLKNKP
jgi:predicted metalloprotease with PDZ domain